MKRIACYVRVSTEEQKKHGLSVDSQIVALQEYCEEHNYHIVDFYNDAGLSASKKLSARKELARLCDDCKAKKIDLILFTKLDRWFRSVPDYYKIQGILDECNVPWQAIWEDYETITSAGKFKVNIMLSIAQAESDRTSERVKAVNEYRKAKGEFVGGQAPLGYMIKKPDLVIDPNTREAVQAFFDEYLLTLSHARAMEKALEHGIRISYPKSLRMLRSDCYAGNAHGYKCEAYISEEQHKIIIESLDNRRNRERGINNIYYFSGIVKCHVCGGSMIGNVCRVKYKDKHYKYPAYHCSSYMKNTGCHSSKQIFQSKIERYLIAELDNMIGKYRIEAESVENSNRETNQQKERLETKLKRIGIRFEDGDISAEEYRAKRDQIKADIQKIEAPTASAKALELPSKWKEIYEDLDDTHKKSFWQGIIKRISYDPTTKSFDVLLK